MASTSVDVDSGRTAIHTLRRQLNSLFSIRSPLVSWIPSPEELEAALDELEAIVEMNEIKVAIVRQIQFFIVREAIMGQGTTSSEPSRTDGHMLHTAITGSPGVGKTKIGILLAKIWAALGFLGKRVKPVEGDTSSESSLHDSLRRRFIGCFELLNEVNQDLTKLDRKLKRESQIGDSGGTSRTMSRLRQHLTRTRKLLESSMELISEKQKSERTESIVIAYRSDLVGQYQGHSAQMTRDFLQAHRGQVILIDEAYQLYTGKDDQFGMEALTTLVQDMSEHPEDIVILVGYLEELTNTIFKAQRGLYRRITWFFHIDGYTPSGLAEIFVSQLRGSGWTTAPDCDVRRFFAEHAKEFEFYGGDTSKLAFYCKLVYSHASLQRLIGQQTKDESISNEMIGQQTKDESISNVMNESPGETRTIQIDPCIDCAILEQGFRLFLINRESMREKKEEMVIPPPPPGIYL